MIRKFRQSDIEQILDIWLNASIEAHNFIEKTFWESRVTDMRDIYIPASETYVYVEKGQIKGFISLCNDSIESIFVSPGEQRAGIGGKLIDKAKELRRKLKLTVYEENLKGINFYKKRGFKIEKEQVCRHTGHRELVMTFEH